jgi:hypothetical protein
MSLESFPDADPEPLERAAFSLHVGVLGTCGRRLTENGFRSSISTGSSTAGCSRGSWGMNALNSYPTPILDLPRFRGEMRAWDQALLALRHVILRFRAFFGSAPGGAILPSRPAH